MQAILIKILPATNHKDVRLKAIACAGEITESRKYGLEMNDQARALALRLAAEFWNISELTGFGCLKNGDYVATIGV